MEVTHNFIDFTELDEIWLVLWTEGTWEQGKSQCPLDGGNPFRDTTDLNWDPNVPNPQCTDEIEFSLTGLALL